MAESNPTPQAAKPAAKPRNPVERVIVWGFIAAMLVLVAIEGNSWWQHKQAFAALSARTKAVDETPDAPAVTEADIKAYFHGKEATPKKPEAGNNFTGASRIDVYSWFTISPVNKREIYVYYGKESKQDKNGPEVLAIQVKDEAPPAPAQVAAGEQPSAGPPPGGGMMPPGMQGGPGGGQRGRPPGHDSAASKPDGEKTGDEQPAGEKSDGDKPGDEKPDGEKTDNEQQ
jgi:translation initiation factor IF-2